MSTAPALTGEDYAFSLLTSYAAYQWPGYQVAPHHRLIAEHLEAVERGDITRLMITMPPRHGKSMLASEFFPAWYMGRNPDHYVVTATYAQELADDFGRKVKNQIEDSAYQAIFPGVGLSDDSKSAKRFHVEGSLGGIEHATKQRGAFYAVGVGGPLTGRGAHLLLIDDPVKNREDAESEIMRKKTKDWYTSTAYTRLMPGGRIVVIQCMVGDTPVLMADGTEKLLRDVAVGDLVASMNGDTLTASKVLNWSNNGPDLAYEIRTTSGTTVKANERHPFLVECDGATRWVRLRDLKIGDKVRRVIGGSGVASRAAMKGVTSPQEPKVTATLIIPKPDGRTVLDHHRQSTPSARAIGSSNTATASVLWSMTPCSQPKMGFVRSVFGMAARAHQPIGPASSALTTITQPAVSEDCSVTTATSLLGEAGTPLRSNEPLDTWSVTSEEIVSILPCGHEDVYDIQVAYTENFIANGLVSHNTRWHEDDLSGWLQAKHEHEGWVVLNLPAINSDGVALWPEQYPVEALERIKRALPSRDWSALYQQAPSPETGDYFKREWLIPVEQQHIPPLETMMVYGGSDYAVTADGGDYTVHSVVGVASDGRMFLLDLWRAQASSDVWVDAFCNLVRKWRPIGWAEETGQIKSGVGPFLMKRMIESESFVAREQFPTRGDKAIRAQSIRGRMASQGLMYPRDAPWASDFISELMSFPVGVHDDQVDAIGLCGQLMDRMASGNAPKERARVVPRGAIVPPPIAQGRRR